MPKSLKYAAIFVLCLSVIVIIFSLSYNKWLNETERYYVTLWEKSGKDMHVMLIVPQGDSSNVATDLIPISRVRFFSTWSFGGIAKESEGTMYIYESGLVYDFNNPEIDDLYCFPSDSCKKNAP